jgi:nucleoside-diphosphate-sugar epimerase
VIPVKGDICNYESVNKAIQNCDYVFHTAAFTDLKSNKLDNFYNNNVTGTHNVLRASLENNIKKVIHTSTLSVFGPSLFQVPITENQPRMTSYANDYELTKKMSEDLVLKFVKKGLSSSILNVTRVYGPGLNTHSNGVNKIISKIMNDSVFLVPSNLKIEANYVYIDDVVNAQILALKHGISGEKYIIGGENIDYDGLFEKIINLSNSNISIFKINYNFIKSAFALRANLNSVLGMNGSITPKVLDSLFTHRSASSAKAISLLDYKITPLDKGIEKTIKFLT